MNYSSESIVKWNWAWSSQHLKHVPIMVMINQAGKITSGDGLYSLFILLLTLELLDFFLAYAKVYMHLLPFPDHGQFSKFIPEEGKDPSILCSEYFGWWDPGNKGMGIRRHGIDLVLTECSDLIYRRIKGHEILKFLSTVWNDGPGENIITWK